MALLGRAAVCHRPQVSRVQMLHHASVVAIVLYNASSIVVELCGTSS